MGLIAVVVFASQKMNRVLDETRGEAETAEREANAAMLQRRITENNLLKLTRGSKALRESSRTWLPHFGEVPSAQEAERRVAELIRTEGIFLLSQKYEVLDGKKGDFVERIVACELEVEDNYAETLNWFGKLEEALPIGRVAKCVVERGDRGNDINLHLEFEIPLAAGNTDADSSTEIDSES